MTLAKTTNHLCDGHRLYNHNQQTYAQSEVQPVACYYMIYTRIHNIYIIYRYGVIEYTYLVGNTQSAHKQAIQEPSVTVTYNK